MSDLSEFPEIELVSGAVYTDTITVFLRKAVGTSGFLSLYTVHTTVTSAAFTEVCGWTTRGLQLLFI